MTEKANKSETSIKITKGTSTGKEEKNLTSYMMYGVVLVAAGLLIYQFLVFFALPITVTGSSFRPTAGAPNNDVITAFLPGDGDIVRPYQWDGKDVRMDEYAPTNGEYLVEMEKEIDLNDLSSSQRSTFDRIAGNVYHPCCDTTIDSCGCLHAVAGRGLAKKLLLEGWSEDQIYDELLLWQKLWWPKHYAGVATYLNQQGQSPFDFDSKTLLGMEFSTVRAGRTIGAELGIKLY